MRLIKHKFNARPTIKDNIHFKSQKEARYFDILKTAQAGGYVLFFLRQPMFDLPGGVTYKADFLVFYADGTAKVIDVKGKRTKDYIRNKKQVEALYPVQIEEV